MTKLAPSILSADFGCLAEQMKTVEKAGAHLLHVDVMDGHFVPNLTIGPVVVAGINQHTDLELDVHLMIDNPGQYIKPFSRAGADMITFHMEAVMNVADMISEIKAEGLKAGVAVNPDTAVETLDDVVAELDMVTIMSVHPGFGGQSFIEGSCARIRRTRQLIDRLAPEIELEVDGGINLENAGRIIEAGADILVAGAAVFGNESPEEAIKRFLAIMSEDGRAQDRPRGMI